MDRIEIAGLQIDAIIGVLEQEQRAPQRIEAELSLELPLEAAGDRSDLAQSVDYAAVAEQIRFLAAHGRFRLLESLAVAALRLLLLPPAPIEGRAPIQRVSISLRKPEILAGICVPGVHLSRDAGFAPPERERGEGIREATLVELPEGRAYRRVLEEGASLPAGDHAHLVLAGQVEAGGLHGAGARVARGVAVRTVHGAVLLSVGQGH